MNDSIRDEIAKATRIVSLEKDVERLASIVQELTGRMSQVEKLVYRAAGAAGLFASIFGSIAGAVVGAYMS